MSKTLKAVSVWFGIRMTEPKKCVGLREKKVPIIDWLPWFRVFENLRTCNIFYSINGLHVTFRIFN